MCVVVLLLLGAYEITFNRTRKTFRGLVCGSDKEITPLLQPWSSRITKAKLIVLVFKNVCDPGRQQCIHRFIGLCLCVARTAILVPTQVYSYCWYAPW